MGFPVRSPVLPLLVVLEIGVYESVNDLVIGVLFLAKVSKSLTSRFEYLNRCGVLFQHLSGNMELKQHI